MSGPTIPSERGASLLEAMVALVILLLAMTTALGMYDGMLRSFHVKENLMEQQQGVRVGFDAMIGDLQRAGFNHNPDGNATRPDEPLEGAFATALVFRGDFDADDATLAGTPEASLAGGGFDTVSIGNDEIVAFVLAKPDGSSPGSLSFSADVAQSARDGVVENVTIPGVAAVQDRPPYTLYRITLNNDIATYGGNAFFIRTPLIDNVKSLAFHYYDLSGVEIASPGGAETATDVATRSRIRRIQLDVVGLTRDPDMDWKDPVDPDPATRSFRKFRLTGDVTPRNLGHAGMRDLTP